VFVTALETLAIKNSAQLSRKAIQQELAKPSFQAAGASGPIRFSGSDRREAMNVLLTVVPSKNCNQYGHSFVSINHPAAKGGVLDCLSLKNKN
jgi:ABC-type branched-subunit amino acid transport system substrate-binding protein